MMPVLIAHLPVWLIIIPLLGGIACFLTGKRAQASVGVITAVFLSAMASLTGIAVFRAGLTRYAVGGWGMPAGIDFKLDGLSAIMVILTAVVGMAVSAYASGYFRQEHSREKAWGDHEAGSAENFFWPLWLFTWGGLNALFLSADIFNIYVCLEIMTFAAIALVALAGSEEAITASLRYLFVSLFGSLMYLLGVALLYSAHGRLDMDILGGMLQPGAISAWAISLITLGLVVKAALFPMHFWLPPAHANAPAPVSAVLSGLVVMAAFYLLTRFWVSVFAAVLVPAVGQILGALGVLAVFYGALQALRQPRLKMIIAYSTVAQIGYMFFLFPLITGHSIGGIFAWNGGVYFAVSHACAKAAAFLVAGSITISLGHDNIKGMTGMARRFPIGVFTLAIAGLSLTGLPPSGGFVGKWLLLKAAMLSGQWWYALIILTGSLLAACYVIRVLEVMLRAPSSRERKTGALSIPLRMQYSALALSCVAVLMGVAASVPLEIMNTGTPALKSVTGAL